MILAIWFISRPVTKPQVVIDIPSWLISDLLIPLGSDGSGHTILDITPAQTTEEWKNLIFLQNIACQLPAHTFSGSIYFTCVSKEDQGRLQKVKSFGFPVGYTILWESLFPLTILMIDDFASYDQPIIKKEISEKWYDIKKTMFQFVEPSNADTKVKVDLDSFEAIDYLYARDKNSVYYQGRVVHGIDPKTMKIIDNERVQDKNWVAYNWEVISEVHGTIQILSEGYWKDDTTVFYYGSKKSKLDPKTFELFYNSFSKDKSGVYWTTWEKISLLDSNSFETKWWIWWIDKDYISCGNTVIHHSDSKTFRNYETWINLKLGNYGFAWDKNFVYFCWLDTPITLLDADPASFKSLMPMTESAPPYFWKWKDKNHVYQCNPASWKCTKT